MPSTEEIQRLLKEHDWQTAQHLADGLAEKGHVRIVAPTFVREAMANKDEVALIKYLDMWLQQQPDAMDAVDLRVKIHLHKRETELAALCYERAARLHRAPADLWFNAAYYMKQAGKYEQALSFYQAALDANVSDAHQVYLNMAVIQSDYLANENLARQYLEKAVELEPNFSDAWYNLGNLEEQQANGPKARKAFLNAYQSDPHYFSALARLADLKTFTDEYDPDIRATRRGINNPRASSSDRCFLLYGLGKMLNDCKNYNQAWGAYVEANRLNRNNQKRYHREEHEKFVDSIIESYPQVFNQPSGDANGPELIFICGMFRSGSTLAEQVLGVLPEISNGGEIEHLHRVLTQKPNYFPEYTKGLTSDRLKKIRDAYLREVSTAFPEAEILTDKRPENYRYVGLIKQVFPKAKFIWTQRAPLDNALSAYFQYLGPGMSYATSLDDTLHYHDQMQRLKLHWQGLYPESIFTLDYDQFVSEPIKVARELLSFLEIDWNGEILNFHTRRNSVKTASVWQVRKPLYKTSSGRCQQYIEAIRASSMYPEFCARFNQED
ncbi:sulfotransferase family protein [Pseudoalteromonas sp. BDTF-M6]|uniref:tetratricopeptide repeat-containing sulfotransferase family protein n=1 Tax=Pseudoalteromonas sp. BDTF-M6 TaxID=2796132 RepID=UPI001BAF74E1|nr:sulfotransferase family protein [Pseudoalteromonas sp. BDTF-M6]MBS3798634.1 sulfotransferase [Pseudoalteromonas sp. BDTF-M6]